MDSAKQDINSSKNESVFESGVDATTELLQDNGDSDDDHQPVYEMRNFAGSNSSPNSYRLHSEEFEHIYVCHPISISGIEDIGTQNNSETDGKLNCQSELNNEAMDIKSEPLIGKDCTDSEMEDQDKGIKIPNESISESDGKENEATEADKATDYNSTNCEGKEDLETGKANLVVSSINGCIAKSDVNEADGKTNAGVQFHVGQCDDDEGNGQKEDTDTKPSSLTDNIPGRNGSHWEVVQDRSGFKNDFFKLFPECKPSIIESATTLLVPSGGVCFIRCLRLWRLGNVRDVYTPFDYQMHGNTFDNLTTDEVKSFLKKMSGNEVASSTENTTIVCGEDGPHYSDAKPDLNIFETECSLTARASAIMKAMKEGMETGYLTVKTNKKQSTATVQGKKPPTVNRTEKIDIALTQIAFLPTDDMSPSKQELFVARDILEVGAQWAIARKDIPAFERYMAQLKCYYMDYKDNLPESTYKYQLLGLNLLCLLSQNRLAEFHTVFLARGNVPAENYNFFIDILLNTIRNEIALYIEKAYAKIGLNEAARMLFYDSVKLMKEYAQQRNWELKSDGFFFFKQEEKDTDEVIPAKDLAEQTIAYARELEMIV